MRLIGLDLPGLRRALADLGEEPFHGEQIYRWLYARGADGFEEMTDLSRPLRRKLEELADCGLPLASRQRLDSPDGTRRYRVRLTRDGLGVETVYIPDARRRTVCLSTQAGCRYGCRFCRTARVPLRRGLGADEIAAQFMFVQREIGERKGWNVVLMGMGEPLDNAEESARALLLLADPQGLAVSRNRLTLSTVGLVPQLRALAGLPFLPKIAVSLNATTDETRSRLMPVNRRYPLAELLEACRSLPLRRGNRVTFEYVLLAGVNDADEDARRLPRLLRGIPSKVNLIPFNPWAGCSYAPPAQERVARFQELLLSGGLNATIRRSRGAGIGAACGQLSGEGDTEA